MSDQPNRIFLVDLIRSTAIYLMIFYHFFYDLYAINLYPTPIFTHWFWFGLPRLIVALFCLAMGYSLEFSHRNGFHKDQFLYRLGKLITGAMFISLITFIFEPHKWVYFGTLHLLATSSVVSLLFLKRQKLSLWFGLALVIPFLLTGKSLPWFSLPHPSMDYIPLFPWFGFVLLGMSSYGRPSIQSFSLSHPIWAKLAWPSKYSLRIYLLHQPIIYGSLYLYAVALKSF